MADAPTPADDTPAELTREQLWDQAIAADDSATVTPQDAPASDGPEAPEVPDVLADAQPPNTDQIEENEQARIARLEHQLASSQGRLAKLDTARKAAPSASKDQSPARDNRKKLDAVRSEYPDVVGPLVDTVDELQKQIDAMAAIGQQSIDEQSQAFQEQLAEQEAIFKAEHPDGEDIITQNVAVFRGWINSPRRPKYLHDIFVANERDMVDGTGVALLVSEFKIALAQATPDLVPAKDSTQQRRESQLAGAQATKQTSPKAMTGAPPADAPDRDAAFKWALSVM